MPKQSRKHRRAPHQRLGLLIWLVVIGGLVLIGVLLQPEKAEKADTTVTTLPEQPDSGSARERRARNEGMVPVQQGSQIAMIPYLMRVESRFTGVASTPSITPGRLHEAVDFLLQLEGDPGLSTEDDLRIFELLRVYHDTPGQLRTEEVDNLVVGLSADGPVEGRIGYSCSRDTYGIRPDIQSSAQGLAISFYHEVMHAVLCRGLMVSLGVTDHAATYEASRREGMCTSEFRPYAAQTRLMPVLSKRGLLPTHISASETSEAGVLHTIVEAWKALDGQRFCDWIKMMMSGGANRPPQQLYWREEE